jgi:YihY family inner membrane protein
MLVTTGRDLHTVAPRTCPLQRTAGVWNRPALSGPLIRSGCTSTSRRRWPLTSSRSVPETSQTAAGADSPLSVVRAYGLRAFLRDTFARLRYSDGFSHARALALLLCLAVVPLLIALTGLADEVGLAEGGRVIALTTLSLTPGRSDALVRRLLLEESSGDTGEAALVIGLITAGVAVTVAMAQIERGANRLYGIGRDRPTGHKYGRAVMLAVSAGAPAFGGFLLVVGGRGFGTALEQVYGWGTPLERVWTVLHVPVALILTVTAVAALFRWAPRRRQPSWRWLLPGVLLSTFLWILVTALLAGYVTSGLSFSRVYGPLTGIMALLLWANAGGVALFAGLACCAQLEACRAEGGEAQEPAPGGARASAGPDGNEHAGGCAG